MRTDLDNDYTKIHANYIMIDEVKIPSMCKDTNLPTIVSSRIKVIPHTQQKNKLSRCQKTNHSIKLY